MSEHAAESAQIEIDPSDLSQVISLARHIDDAMTFSAIGIDYAPLADALRAFAREHRADDEEFCPNCCAGVESSEHHEKCEAETARLVAEHPRGIPSGPAAIHFCPVPDCLDIWESEATCEHAALIPEESDPYDRPIGVFEGTRWHMHAEPICADPNCVTYLTRAQMTAMRNQATPPVSDGGASDA